jgi:hypothetical protein
MQKQNGQFQAIPNWPLSRARLPASVSPGDAVPGKPVFPDQQSWTSVTAKLHDILKGKQFQ